MTNFKKVAKYKSCSYAEPALTEQFMKEKNELNKRDANLARLI